MATKMFKVCLGTAVASALVLASPAEARVIRIILGTPAALAYTPPIPGAPPFLQVRGTLIGQLDPTDPHNTIITDINHAPTVMNAQGKPVVQYTTTFVLTYPQNRADVSGLMWHNVPNRGSAGQVETPQHAIVPAERALGDVGL